MKQDKLSLLEQELDQVDKDETRQLFLGSCRRDQNAHRKHVMHELDKALADYGMRSHRVNNCGLDLIIASRFICGKRSEYVRIFKSSIE